MSDQHDHGHDRPRHKSPGHSPSITDPRIILLLQVAWDDFQEFIRSEKTKESLKQQGFDEDGEDQTKRQQIIDLLDIDPGLALALFGSGFTGGLHLVGHLMMDDQIDEQLRRASTNPNAPRA